MQLYSLAWYKEARRLTKLSQSELMAHLFDNEDDDEAGELEIDPATLALMASEIDPPGNQ